MTENQQKWWHKNVKKLQAWRNRATETDKNKKEERIYKIAQSLPCELLSWLSRGLLLHIMWIALTCHVNCSRHGQNQNTIEFFTVFRKDLKNNHVIMILMNTKKYGQSFFGFVAAILR